MNFKTVLQAFSSALQSNTTTPPIPTAPIQNRTGHPIPEAILIELDLLGQDQDQDQDQDYNHTTSQQSISTAPPPIPTTPTSVASSATVRVRTAVIPYNTV